MISYDRRYDIFIYLFIEDMRGHFSPESHLGFEAAAWYWHFGRSLAILFAAVYVWGGGYSRPCAKKSPKLAYSILVTNAFDV